MQRITQKAFVEAMTRNSSIFIGVAHQKQEGTALKEAFDSEIERWKLQGIPRRFRFRTCRARSKDLIFSNDSHLDLSGREFFRLEGNGYAVLSCVERWIDRWDNVECVREMIYLILETSIPYEKYT